MRVWMVVGDELWYREMRLYVAMYITRVFFSVLISTRVYITLYIEISH